MKRIRNLYENIYDFDNLLQAYYMARKSKRYREEVLRFSNNLEENLITLQNELIWQTYEVGRYREFFVYEPKKRLVMALPFRDRVVQWAIYRQLNPLLERRYINTSYACRVGYGTHRAVGKLQQYLRLFSRINQPFYVLKLDISKYFYRIDHDVLLSILRRIIADERLLQLLETIIRSETKFGMELGDHDFVKERIGDIGIPIGNLTSQMFANLYLNELDQYCKHVLKTKHYVRYMDDVCILHHDKKRLWAVKDSIEQFLTNRLKLTLNNKTTIRTTNQGVDFCGYRIWPTHIKLRKTTALKMKRRIKRLQKKYRQRKIDFAGFNASLNSYLGIMQHCNSYKLRRKLLASICLRKEGLNNVEGNPKEGRH